MYKYINYIKSLFVGNEAKPVSELGAANVAMITSLIGQGSFEAEEQINPCEIWRRTALRLQVEDNVAKNKVNATLSYLVCNLNLLSCIADVDREHVGLNNAVIYSDHIDQSVIDDWRKGLDRSIYNLVLYGECVIGCDYNNPKFKFTTGKPSDISRVIFSDFHIPLIVVEKVSGTRNYRLYKVLNTPLEDVESSLDILKIVLDCSANVVLDRYMNLPGCFYVRLEVGGQHLRGCSNLSVKYNTCLSYSRFLKSLDTRNVVASSQFAILKSDLPQQWDSGGESARRSVTIQHENFKKNLSASLNKAQLNVLDLPNNVSIEFPHVKDNFAPDIDRYYRDLIMPRPEIMFSDAGTSTYTNAEQAIRNTKSSFYKNICAKIDAEFTKVFEYLTHVYLGHKNGKITIEYQHDDAMWETKHLSIATQLLEANEQYIATFGKPIVSEEVLRKVIRDGIKANTGIKMEDKDFHEGLSDILMGLKNKGEAEDVSL